MTNPNDTNPDNPDLDFDDDGDETGRGDEPAAALASGFPDYLETHNALMAVHERISALVNVKKIREAEIRAKTLEEELASDQPPPPPPPKEKPLPPSSARAATKLLGRVLVQVETAINEVAERESTTNAALRCVQLGRLAQLAQATGHLTRTMNEVHGKRMQWPRDVPVSADASSTDDRRSP